MIASNMVGISFFLALITTAFVFQSVFSAAAERGVYEVLNAAAERDADVLFNSATERGDDGVLNAAAKRDDHEVLKAANERFVDEVLNAATVRDDDGGINAEAERGVKEVLSAATERDVKEVLNVLLQRIESIERREAAKDAKITEMESELSGLRLKIAEMELKFKQKEDMMLDEINDIKKTLEQSDSDANLQQPDDIDDIDQPSVPNVIKSRESSYRLNPVVHETKVAFYATYTDHSIHQLRLNQVLLFQQPITNIGNAFNNNTGTFVAPVTGTYVFHAMLKGTLDKYYYYAQVHLAVDDERVTTLSVSDLDHTAHISIIIDLKVGQNVSLRHDLDFRLVSQYCTFSGFLLYPRFPSVTTIG